MFLETFRGLFTPVNSRQSSAFLSDGHSDTSQLLLAQNNDESSLGCKWESPARSLKKVDYIFNADKGKQMQ